MVMNSLVGAVWLSSTLSVLHRWHDGSSDVDVGLHTSPALRNPKKQVVNGGPKHQVVLSD